MQKANQNSQRGLFLIVAAIAVVLAVVLFVFLRPKPAAADPAAGARFVFGPADAKVTIVDFSNYLCPHCADHALRNVPEIFRDYVDTGKVRYIFRDFPFTGQDNVIRASEAAACAADANRYKDYHEVLFRAQRLWGGLSGAALDQFFIDLASQLGLPPGPFADCLRSGSKRAGVLADRDLTTQLALRGTPTFYVNGQLYDDGYVPYDKWKERIENALAGKTSAPSPGGESTPAPKQP
jgi:protein-disulfide isomerase